MASQFLKTTPILRMFDIRKAREFYLDFLGFELDFEHRLSRISRLYGDIAGLGVGISANTMAIAPPAPRL